MRRARLIVIVSWILLLGAALSASAEAASDGGRASAEPWSGYWWQHKAGGLTGPLGKYDGLLGTEAAQWEQTTHVADDAPDWFGHCHAWAASSVCEKEPGGRRVVSQVRFGVGDQKGLLAACHAQDVSNSYGDRFGDDEGSEDRGDLSPDELWRLLQMYVKQRKLPLILDLEAGPQVWNYPVYQYRIEYEAVGDGWCNGTMQLVAADNNVQPDYVGTQVSLYDYTFRIKFEDGAVLSGSGEWTGDSAEDHPDFAWYPYVAVAENPEVEVAEVSKIVGYAVGGSNPPPDDDSDDRPPDVPPPDDDDDDIPSPPPEPTDDILSPEELVAVVLNKTSSFPLDIFTDKGDGGRYRPGEPIRVSFRSGEAGYLYLFHVGPKGDIQLLFPLSDQSNRIKKDVLYDIPGKSQKPWFVAGAHGQHDLKAVVTSRPIQITGFRQLPDEERSDQVKPRRKQPPSVSKPEKLVVCPTARRGIQQRLLGFFRKSDVQEGAAPAKLGPFAQDMCAYFVLTNTR